MPFRSFCQTWDTRTTNRLRHDTGMFPRSLFQCSDFYIAHLYTHPSLLYICSALHVFSAWIWDKITVLGTPSIESSTYIKMINWTSSTFPTMFDTFRWRRLKIVLLVAPSSWTAQLTIWPIQMHPLGWTFHDGCFCFPYLRFFCPYHSRHHLFYLVIFFSYQHLCVLLQYPHLFFIGSLLLWWIYFPFEKQWLFPYLQVLLAMPFAFQTLLGWKGVLLLCQSTEVLRADTSCHAISL